ncbi:MAG: nitrile hydratase accessory protein [Ideonella sp.]
MSRQPFDDELGLLNGQPRDHDGPVFSEPWQAQAFAMTVALHQRGAFSWTEWATALSQQISAAQSAGDPDHGDTYYQHWLAALESLVAAKGLASADQLHNCAHAWEHAAHRTPHGQPIELRSQDFDPLEPGT